MRSEEQGAVALPAQLAAAAAAPQIAQVNVSQNSRMHIGPSFVNVTQNVHHDRVIKGRLLGLWLETRLRGVGGGGGVEGRRLRCSVAVFVCWALVVAMALAVYVAYLALATHPHRVDLEDGVCRVVWAWARATTRGERLMCCAGLAALALCALAAGVLASREPPEPPDTAAWFISRQEWLARNISGQIEDELVPYKQCFLPLRLVVVQHTVGPTCFRFAACASYMRMLLEQYVHEHRDDVPYSFVLGNDARVYEGRGWELMGAHTRTYNWCALGLGFTGNYANRTDGTVPTAQQMASMRRLLTEGVEMGHLHPRFVLLGARDVQSNSTSPGDLLYAEMRKFPEAPADPLIYRDRNCSQIYQFEHFDDVDGTSNETAADAAATPPVI